MRVRSYTQNPADLTAYGPLEYGGGQQRLALEITGAGPKGVLLGRVEGVTDRNGAEALRGVDLYVDRSRLPETEDDETYYHADLIGLAAVDKDGEPLGRVAAVHDFGAGELLEIVAADGTELFLPFTKKVVPEIDLEAGRLTIVQPAELRPENESDGA